MTQPLLKLSFNNLRCPRSAADALPSKIKSCLNILLSRPFRPDDRQGIAWWCPQESISVNFTFNLLSKIVIQGTEQWSNFNYTRQMRSRVKLLPVHILRFPVDSLKSAAVVCKAQRCIRRTLRVLIAAPDLQSSFLSHFFSTAGRLWVVYFHSEGSAGVPRVLPTLRRKPSVEKVTDWLSLRRRDLNAFPK
jgi:hypothetical protein